MKKYKPNWSDPRIVRRVNHSLDYALANLSTTKPRQWSTRRIDYWFGQQQNRLSQLIRSELLVCVDSFYNPERGIAKKYLLNWQGVEKLARCIDRPISTPTATRISAADTVYGSDILSAAFVYQQKNNRLYTPLQYLTNDIRKPLFANYGYIHEYDIKTAAPQILTQYSRTKGLTRTINTVDDYLQDPNSSRQQLAEVIGTDYATAKKLITARFAGARLGYDNALSRLLNQNRLQYERLKNNTWFELLTIDIKHMWDAIKQDLYMSRLSARDKWNIYFQEELRVMRSTHRYLSDRGITYFHEHDGWRSRESVDVRELKLHIHKQTGYWLDFDETIFETSDYT